MRKSVVVYVVLVVVLCCLGGLTACNNDSSVASEDVNMVSTNTPTFLTSDEPMENIELVAMEEKEPVVSTTHISVLGEETIVDAAQSTLVRMNHGIYMTFDTANLPAGEAYAIWWVIFNQPENCSEQACGVNDMALVDEEGNRLYTEEGAPRPNIAQREATQFSLLRATGTVVDIDGTAEFRAHLPVGDAIEAEYGPGLLDPYHAEIHLVARTHGMAIPGQVHDQLNSAWGGCPQGWPKDPCRDVQVAVHHAAPE